MFVRVSHGASLLAIGNPVRWITESRVTSCVSLGHSEQPRSIKHGRTVGVLHCSAIIQRAIGMALGRRDLSRSRPRVGKAHEEDRQQVKSAARGGGWKRQVGIRCRHCQNVAVSERLRGSTKGIHYSMGRSWHEWRIDGLGMIRTGAVGTGASGLNE
jgi:hypothetical protein